MNTLIATVLLTGTLTVLTVAPGLAEKPQRPGGNSTSDHIPVQIEFRDDPGDGIRSTNPEGDPYVHGQDDVICELNTPGSLTCDSTDFKSRSGRHLLFDLGGVGGLNEVDGPFRITTTFCTVRDLQYMEKDTDCHLNLRFEYAGTEYALRFDPSVPGSTPVTSECTDSSAMGDTPCGESTLTADGPLTPTAVLFEKVRNNLEFVGLVPMTTEIHISIRE